MSDERLLEAIKTYEGALKWAREGHFDKTWEECPPIDGESQRDIFFRRSTAALERLRAEAVRRGLSLPTEPGE